MIARGAVGVLGNLSRASVVLGISPLHVAGQSPSQQGVEQTGVKFHPIGVAPALDLYSPQHRVPSCLRLFARPVEGEWCLRLHLEVPPRVLNTGVGQAHFGFNHQTSAALKIQVQPTPRSLHRPVPGVHVAAAKGPEADWFLIYLSHEVHFDDRPRLVTPRVLRMGHHETLHLARP